MIHRTFRLGIAFFFGLQLCAGLAAQGLRAVAPESVGLSADRLERLEGSLQEYVDQGRVPGLVTLLLRDGQIAHVGTYGVLDPQSPSPMPVDAIFRIASQSKAVTSVAIMMLQEEGRLLLGDPVSKFIPQFAEGQVAVPFPGAPGQYAVVPLERPITIRHLLTQTAGISYGNGPAAARYQEANLQGWFFADRDAEIGEEIRRLARLPYDAQPGERYIYGYSTDILGHVVEVVSGMSLDEFFQDRIFQPLGMNDTHFFLPESKAPRLTPVYGLVDGRLQRIEGPRVDSYLRGPRKAYSGGAGLVSTAYDYARFLQMLLNGGELEGVRLLSPKSVELMISDQIGDLFEPGMNSGRRFGLGFWIIEQLGRTGRPGTVGSFGWGGAYHTTYWVDPREKLVAVLMTQMLPATGLDLHDKFRALVYQAIVESRQPVSISSLP